MRQEIRTAFWLAFAGFLWVILEYVTGLHTVRIKWHETLTWFAFVPTILIYTMHYRKIRQDHAGKLTFKKGLLSGLLATILAVPINLLGFVLYAQIINPNFFESFVNYMVDNKMMLRDTAVSYFSMGSYAVQIAIGTLFTGIMLSVVLSFIYRSKMSQTSN